MPEITSIAHTLAAKRVCEKVVQWSKDRQIISRSFELIKVDNS